MNETSTIAAICTPIGAGGLCVIRISGAEAFEIADQVFQPKNQSSIQQLAANTVVFGHVVDKDARKMVDEGLLTKFAAPHSFTGEDTIEISCHGGVMIARMVLELCIKHGASLAAPGEFSKRAFLHGKMDLSKAEAMIEMISAKSEYHIYNNALLLSGKFQSQVSEARQKLLECMASILAKVEYPDEEIDDAYTGETIQGMESVRESLVSMAESYRTGKILSQGIKTAIIGRPNVGKSSLLNYLLQENRAIVTDVEGTTRDTIAEYSTIRGILFQFIDTAGIRETADEVERIGVERATQACGEADLVLWVEDASQEFSEPDGRFLEAMRGKTVLHLQNKADLVSERHKQGLYISTKTGEGMDALLDQLAEAADYPQDAIGLQPMITSIRQKECLEHAITNVNRAISAAEQGIALDLITIDLQQAISDLGEVTGKTVSDEVIDTIFSRFCLGK